MLLIRCVASVVSADEPSTSDTSTSSADLNLLYPAVYSDVEGILPSLPRDKLFVTGFVEPPKSLPEPAVPSLPFLASCPAFVKLALWAPHHIQFELLLITSL